MKTLVGRLVVLALGVLTIGALADRAQITSTGFQDVAGVYGREYYASSWKLHS